MEDDEPQALRPKARKKPSTQQQQHPLFESSTLVDLCRSVIVAHLEQYPPAMFGACDEEEWEHLLALRHAKSQPKKGTGGLDGKGRMAPAVSHKFLHEVEDANPHLAESKVADELVWKDCVEFKFRRTGMDRPKGLLFPWPVWTEHLTRLVSDLPNCVAELSQLPVNVSLLQKTSAGKAMKKFIKKANPESTPQLPQLQRIMASWMSLASDVKQTAGKTDAHVLADMQIAEDCLSWRQLFAALQERHDSLREARGKRLRQKREQRAVVRPKVVKVRPAKTHRVLDAGSSDPGSKLSQLRQETTQSRQTLMASPRRRTFGDAVASMSCGIKKRKSAPTKTVGLSGGKRMYVPTKNDKVRTLRK